MPDRRRRVSGPLGHIPNSASVLIRGGLSRMRLYKTLMSEMLVYCFVVVLLSGAFLAFFYTPSDRVIYDGSYEPLRGVEMSAAYAAALTTRFEVRGGLLM